MSLPPVPGNDITEIKSPRLTPPWRAWFDSIRSAVSSAQSGVSQPYGSFYDTTTQTIASTTIAYAITLDSTGLSSDVSLVSPGSSKIKVSQAGTYNVQFSAQAVNTAVQDHDIQIWIRLNNADVPYTTGFVSVPSTHGGVDGHIIASWNYFLALAADDYIEFFWQGSNTALSLTSYPAGTTPITPYTPSMIVTVIRVGA